MSTLLLSFFEFFFIFFIFLNRLDISSHREKQRPKEVVVYFFFAASKTECGAGLKQKAGFQLLPSVLFAAHDEVNGAAKN